MIDDDVPELRVLDQPMEAPDEFRLNLRSDLVATFEDAAGETNVVRLHRVGDVVESPRRGRRLMLGAAAACVMLAVGAIVMIVTNRDAEDVVEVTDRATACLRFEVDAPSIYLLFGDTTDEGDRTLERRADSIEQLQGAVDDYLEHAARLGFVDPSSITRLAAASGALTEARLDLERGDAAGSVEAVQFALDRLAQVDIERSGSTNEWMCR